jgi:glutathione S-transferase
LKAFRDIDVEEIIREEKLDRLQRWIDAVRARPSAKSTKPSDDVIINSWRKFVVELK